MGSLVPGWDGHQNPDNHREFKDKEEVEAVGYFAKLEKSRSARHSDQSSIDDAPIMGALPTAYSLNRGSVDISDLGRKSASPPSRSSDLGRRSGSLRSPRGQATDWSSELKSLGGQKIELHHAEQKREKGAWWENVDAGVLNARVHVPIDPSVKSVYVPQFNVTGQKQDLPLGPLGKQAFDKQAK